MTNMLRKDGKHYTCFTLALSLQAFKGIVKHLWKYSYLISLWEFDEKTEEAIIQ